MFGKNSRIIKAISELKEIRQKISSLNDLKMLDARILINQQSNMTDKIISNLHLAEFKVFSQWGDDGIIQFLVNYLDIPVKTFVEFGVENYTEANTRFLLVNNNWRGLIMDGSSSNMDYVRNDEIYWKHNLTAIAAFVTKENINSLINSAGISGEIGLLHIDIDGNDYWVWKEISVINPVIVIVEYNSVFGPENTWTIPYDPAFRRTTAHYSNLYYGASIAALCTLAAIKGYTFIGCNSSGNNAYFVRNDKLKNLKALTPSEGYVCSQFRESRNKNGELSYITAEARLEAISGLPVYNTSTGEIEKI